MYDCSAIFVLADVVWVLNNEFVNDNADLDYDLINANAMEIHTKEAYIKNNIVKNCRFSFIVCSDANVNIEYAQFKDNYVENCDTVIYAENSAGNYIDTVEMINIHGTLRHTNETRAFFDFAVSVPLKKLIVRHCDVKNTYDSAVAATASSETSGFVKSVNSDMIEICDNTFDGCYGAGIYIIPMNSSNMEVNISRNNLKNCVMSSNVLGKPNYGAFIGFEDASDMKSVIIDGNITEKNDSNSKVTHLAYLSGTYSNVNISDNKVIGYTGKIRVGGVLGDSIIHHACSVPPTFIGDNKAPCSIGSTWYDSSAGLHYTKTANNNAVDGWDVDTVSDVKTMLVLTQAAYTALATKDPNTLYLING
jgi:hypothetical protein